MSNEVKHSFRIVSDTRQNAKTWANKFDARMILPGLVSYEDVGCGKALVSYETIQQYADTFIGRPLIVTDKLSHKPVSPETMEKDASGYIERVYFDQSDGWFHCAGIVFDDKAKNAINKVGLVSCAYKVLKTGNGGERNAIKYDEEILQFSGEHLAIVSNPRYEGATIRLNSKQPTKSNMSLFKFWKKPAPAATAEGQTTEGATKENAVTPLDISPESEIELSDGKKATVAQLVEAYNAKAKDGVDGDDEVVINAKGDKVKMCDLVAAYNKATGEVMTNAAEEEEKKKKENARIESEAAAKAKTDADALALRQNSGTPIVKKPDHFRVLTAARENSVFSDGVKVSSGSLDERLNEGKARYGKKTA
jgi:hypothetical protein